MEKEFVPYNLALILKELGFGDPCFGFYGSDGYLYLQYTRMEIYSREMLDVFLQRSHKSLDGLE